MKYLTEVRRGRQSPRIDERERINPHRRCLVEHSETKQGWSIVSEGPYILDIYPKQIAHIAISLQLILTLIPMENTIIIYISHIMYSSYYIIFLYTILLQHTQIGFFQYGPNLLSILQILSSSMMQCLFNHQRATVELVPILNIYYRRVP